MELVVEMQASSTELNVSKEGLTLFTDGLTMCLGQGLFVKSQSSKAQV